MVLHHQPKNQLAKTKILNLENEVMLLVKTF